jgi:hypothetical protein
MACPGNKMACALVFSNTTPSPQTIAPRLQHICDVNVFRCYRLTNDSELVMSDDEANVDDIFDHKLPRQNLCFCCG